MEAKREQRQISGKIMKRNPGHQPLNKEIVELVTAFYEREDNSRQLAGMRDFVTIRGPDGSKIGRVQKKIVLCNLSELYASFKTTYPQISIGFAKFAKLRPVHCELVGANGSYASCLCLIHQNMNLMLNGKHLNL